MNNIFRIIFALFLLSLFQGCASTVDYLADAAARGEENKRCRAWNNPVEAQKCYQRIERNKTFTASKSKIQTYTKPIISSAKLDDEKKRRIELKRKLAAMEAKQKQEIRKNNFECFFAFANKTRCELKRLSSIELCTFLNTTIITKLKYNKRYQEILKEVKFRKLNCGTRNNKNRIVLPKISKHNNQELLKKIESLEARLKQVQRMIDTDVSEPLLEIISNKTKGKRGTITGIARDNVEVAEVSINGKPISLSSSGKFKFTTYVPPTGKKLKVEVTDIAGLTSSKTITLKGNREIADSFIYFDDLNPLGKRVKFNKNSLALIVGVSNYENTKAMAMYADNDALVFKDYATEKLGIPENRIKILVNDGADERDILLSVQEWLRRSAKPNKSDIYIFFAGHGLASQDGKNMYLLPHDGSPRLLDDTAILRDRLFADLKAINPKSVTVFLDTCYSGVTRNEEMLIAGRPIVIKAKEQAIPEGFTLFSAASNEQISRPLEEAKHGMFSYFLMKGMEGDADANNDNKITARELHAYVEQNVVQQSSGSQTPELQGDKDRVLVQFN
ncbi:caspase family protein [Alphaproteobacteria bacterium]|nr:caspase family protein [Alphaproteobacteria bacterium]